jgi:hypothetical protein
MPTKSVTLLFQTSCWAPGPKQPNSAPPNIVIEATKYRDGGGDCAVRWIVETAGSGGINYAVHSLCISASLPEKTQNKNIIVRPLGPDRAAMGQSFEDLKTYQRCP